MPKHPTATIELDLEVTWDTIVSYTPPAPEDWDDGAGPPPSRDITLGDLLVLRLLDRAVGPLATAAVADRLARIRDEQLTSFAAEQITAALTATPGPEMTGDQLTLADMISTEIRAQLTGTRRGAVTRGHPSTVVQAIVSTAVTEAFRHLAADITAQVTAQVRAEIAAQR